MINSSNIKGKYKLVSETASPLKKLKRGIHQVLAHRIDFKRNFFLGPGRRQDQKLNFDWYFTLF